MRFLGVESLKGQELQMKVGIVGAGIVGLAHAWAAAERGAKVTVFERTPKASGASIRNFGMVWVIGQPDAAQPTAMRSRKRWLRLRDEADLWVEPCGSLHLAHHEDEWQVLQEYMELHQHGSRGEHLRLLNCRETMKLSSAANPNGLLGSLWSQTECCVDPTSAVRSLPAWLHKTYGVEFHFSTCVTHAVQGELRTGNRENHPFDHIVVCSGDDFATLFPDVFEQQPIRPCKLHMMRTVSQPNAWRLGPHIAGGLTLRHYPNFKSCPTLGQLAARIENDAPELNRYGIHVMASQNHLEQVVLGDSHQYGDEVEPFDDCRIDDWILRELHKIIQLPTWELQSRWQGVYAKYANGLFFEHAIAPGLEVFTGLGGNGMTLSFGLAEEAWENKLPN